MCGSAVLIVRDLGLQPEERTKVPVLGKFIPPSHENEVTIQDRVEISHLETGPRIFDSLIWMKEVIPDLSAETRFSLLLILSSLFSFSFFFFDAGQTTS